MDNYSFALVVRNLDFDDEVQVEALDCLHYDALASSSGGVQMVDVTVPGASPIDAFVQVMSDMRAARLEVERVMPDLVSVPEIAFRTERSRETVRLWAGGKRRSGFPAHLTYIGADRVWAWADVKEWLDAQGIDYSDSADEPLPYDFVEAFNGAFAQRRAKNTEGWLAPKTKAPVIHLEHRRRDARSPIVGGWTSVGRKPA